MLTMPRVAGALLLTTALVSPGAAFAQNDPTPPAPATPTGGEQVGETATSAEQPPVEVSVPGGGDEIVVRGRRRGNVERTSTQVVSVLSSEQIARTGEGNIAGSLARVTGLSVVGSGYVYVRGLGDRYSLALLNGSPLPSPEPLRRVVPLDIFPTGVIASSLVQKSYSVNYPGEFGGGVINLTTRAVPREPFFTVGVGISGDTFTTGKLGYTYYGGGDSDLTGFDDFSRDTPPALQAFFDQRVRISSLTPQQRQLIGGQIVTGRNSVVQRNDDIPANWSANFSAGRSFDTGIGRLGVIAAAGYSNRWLTRDAIQQQSLSADLGDVETNFRRVITDNRTVVNGLFGMGLEFGQNQLRWTNLFIRDTIKQTRFGIGNRQGNTQTEFLQQNTAWYERQLIDTQVVGEFRPTSELSLDVRAGYANTKRDAPFELSQEYVRTNVASDPFGNLFINRLNGNAGDAEVSFGDLSEDLYSAGADLTYRFRPGYSVTVGGAYADQDRDSERRDFTFIAPSTFPTAIATLRPDLLLSPGIIDFYDIDFIETNETAPNFNAKLRVLAGYAKVNAQFTEALSLDAGVRYERGRQSVRAVPVFTDQVAAAATLQERNYWLPAATLTYAITPQLQFRLSGSKTLARPQFRELIFQFYFDPDSNRLYRGNPSLVDSQLYNAESRLEWYLAPDQRVSVSGFYKRINRPVESFVTPDLATSFANAPKANLYGLELEAQKNFGLRGLGSFFTDRRLVVLGNYTLTKSKLRVAEDDNTSVFGVVDAVASDYFRDGAPLTGQSDHLVNLQLGTEHTNRLSQQTLLLTYASERVVSRGVTGNIPQPDVVERPGLRLDFVAREGFTITGREFELKFEARNLTGRRHVEFQQSGDNRIDVNTYDLGRSFALSASVKL